MAITARSWGRGNTSAGPFAANVWNNIHGGVAALDLDNPMTLLRTLMHCHVKVVVDAGFNPLANWWVYSTVRVGLKFSGDGSTPGFATNDTSPDVLAIQTLRPQLVQGDLTGTGAQAVVWTQDHELDIQTQRRSGAAGQAVVFPFIWATDLGGVFASGGSHIHVEAETQIAALFGV